MRTFSSAANFASGANANYIEMMHEQWEQDPSSVHASWHAYFSGIDAEGNSSFELPPGMGKSSYEKKLENIAELL
jgi:2-oxoglutarate dehydrogenase E1 component